MKLLLTSTGFSFNPKIGQVFLDLINRNTDALIGILTTASIGKENNEFNQLACTQLAEMGCSNFEFVDVEVDPASKLESYDAIYICGGNTFYLLHHLKKSGADKVLIDLAKNEVVLMGVSAGSLIMCPVIDLAGKVNPDQNDVGLADLTALGLIDFEIYPHYVLEFEQALTEYEASTGRKVVKLKNGDAYLVDDDHTELIEV